MDDKKRNLIFNAVEAACNRVHAGDCYAALSILQIVVEQAGGRIEIPIDRLEHRASNDTVIIGGPLGFALNSERLVLALDISGEMPPDAEFEPAAHGGLTIQ